MSPLLPPRTIRLRRRVRCPAPGTQDQLHAEVLITAAARRALRRRTTPPGGLDTLGHMADHATEPRDKTAGMADPRAVGAWRRWGQATCWMPPRINGLKLHGFGGSITALAGAREVPCRGSAIPRSDFDAALLRHAIDAGAGSRAD
ncbi:hypothetical protein [Corynebacterium urealyticum]|uniref:hypothetical protein n=1 Tax=Corynebacterium urealyticum TaxID=43771 RepID=UPI001F443618|nr:hypothetical protein [Corynebacterium urealyticum]